MADAVSAEGKHSGKVLEIADTPVTFKCDVWKYFCFPMSKNEKGGKGDWQAKNYMQTLPDCGDIRSGEYV